MRVQITRRDHPTANNEKWFLEFEGDDATLFNSAQQQVLQFNPTESLALVQFPSFSKSIKYTGILVENAILRFEMDSKALAELRNFANRGILALGPDALIVIRNRAIRDTLLGLLAFFGGIGFSVAGYLAARNGKGGSYTITYGISIFGFAMACRGIYTYFHYVKLRRESARSTPPAPPPQRP